MDTFRAQFPLLNLFYPDESARMLAGFANIARENPFLPEWCSPGHRDCMVGNNSAAVVADAAVKGLVAPADLKVLYDALVYGSENVHPSVSSGRSATNIILRIYPCDVGIIERRQTLNMPIMIGAFAVGLLERPQEGRIDKVPLRKLEECFDASAN